MSMKMSMSASGSASYRSESIWKNGPVVAQSGVAIRLRPRSSLQFRVLGFGLLQDGDVGVGVFPEGEDVLIGSLCLGAWRCRRAIHSHEQHPGRAS